jgi:hypothetical protein
MRPVPIPDARIWADPDTGQPIPRITLGAPPGHEDTVLPVEALIDQPAPGNLPGLQYHVLLALEPGDLERLAADPHCWLTFWGGVIPFALTIPDPDLAGAEGQNPIPETEP